MTLPVGADASDFSAPELGGSFREWQGDGWALVVAMKALSPTCTTEVAALDALLPAFAAEDMRILAIACDPAEQVAQWLDDMHEALSLVPSWPLVRDESLAIAAALDIVDPASALPSLQRAAILVSPAGRIALTLVWPVTNGRNFDEIMRTLRAIRLTDAQRVATPADWQPGGRVMLPPSLAQDEAERRYPDGVEVIRPYLRYIAQP